MAPSLSSFVLVTTLLLAAAVVDAQLVPNYYAKSCPKAEAIVSSIVRARVRQDRTQPAALLRLHFHDCFVLGCEGSVLIDSTKHNVAEKDAPPNAGSLRSFDVIDQIKGVLESVCPGVVSCADILALAARDAVQFSGGPNWRVPTGRKDGRLSRARDANNSLPGFGFNYLQLKRNFAAVGLNEQDLVVLSGAHTIGLTHCRTITRRLYNFPGSRDGVDPTLDKAYARRLQKQCPPTARVQANPIPMDPAAGGETFDTSYYANILTNKALFKADEALITNPRGRSLVLTQVNSPATFFRNFGQSMEKMGRIGVLTGAGGLGEVRKTCSRINPKKRKT